MITTTAQALDELVRQVAWAPAEALTCLHHCQLCRNHLLYLLDTLPLSGGDSSTRIAARLRALPEVHRGHGEPGHPDPGHPDNAPPQIRWILA